MVKKMPNLKFYDYMIKGISLKVLRKNFKVKLFNVDRNLGEA